MYRNCYWCNDRTQGGPCIKLATWDSEGRRVRVNRQFMPYVYIENPHGEYKSIFGTKLEKREFENPFDRKKYVDRVTTDRIFENFDATNQYLLDTYWETAEKEEFTKYELRTLFFDIEVDPIPGGEFPRPEEAKAEINIITIYDYLTKKYHIFSKYNYNGNDLLPDSVFIPCKNERDLLQKFLLFWQGNDYPDIVAGWNSNGFDFPYVFNRIIRVLGDAAYYSLSPYGIVNTRETTDKMGRNVTVYDIAGVTLLDWLDVYTKFNAQKQESYKLDFIADKELGYGKVDYKGMTIYEFMEKDWDKFVEYNVRDVELLVKLEEKLRYFSILRMISNMACLNYNKGLTTIPVTNGAITLRARQRGLKVHTFKRKIDYSKKKPGAFVSSNAGLHHSIVTVDCGSMYPNITISNNISPETKVGLVEFKIPSLSVYNGLPDDELTITMDNGKKYELTREKLDFLIQQKNLVMSANGCLFTQDREGLFPQFMREVYSKRVAVRKEIKALNMENEKMENEIEELQKKLQYGQF